MRIHPHPRLTLSADPSMETDSLLANVAAESVKLKVTDSRLLALLGQVSGGIDSRELDEWIGSEFDVDPKSARAIRAKLQNEGLLLSEQELHGNERAVGSWLEHDWEAAIEQFYSTLDRDYADMDTASEEWVDRVEEAEQAGEDRATTYKRYPDADSIQLSEPGDPDFGSFEAAIDAVGSRAPDERPTPPSEADISNLLYYAFGEVDSKRVPDIGKYIFRTSPSAGARHPTEAYVAVTERAGVDSGVYHYSVADHALEELDADPEAIVAQTVEAGPDPSLVVVLSTRVYRTMEKYPNAQAFQVVHHDAGHLVETLRLLCAGYDREVVASERCDAATISETLSLDRYAEPVFGYVAVY